MAFKKGKSGNPGGRSTEKPFSDALRMEIAAAGADHKALRQIAKNLIRIASQTEDDRTAVAAIRDIADRLDGKPAQEQTVTIDDKRDATDWTRDELVAFLRDATDGGSGTSEANGRGRKSDRVH